jgi:hypothetical protein
MAARTNEQSPVPIAVLLNDRLQPCGGVQVELRHLRRAHAIHATPPRPRNLPTRRPQGREPRHATDIIGTGCDGFCGINRGEVRLLY